jgi:exodeoxyribonuclease III
VRALTYNLLGGQDDDAERFVAALALLRAAAPDVLVLNECNLLALDGAARFGALEAALGMRGRLALAASGFHVAVLFRDAVVEHVETLTEGFSHVALVARVSLEQQPLQVIAAHLDPFSPAQRAREAQLLAARLDADRPRLLLGDLNAISPRDVAAAQPELWVERYRQRHLDAQGAIDTRAIDTLLRCGLVDVHAALHEQTLSTRPSARYARSDRPSQRLDYIFASPQLAATARACEPYAHAFTQSASDHLPLYADLELVPLTARMRARPPIPPHAQG